MSSVLATVDMRTQLAGHNRLELLLFRMQDHQEYGINVFKVQEVIQCPTLTSVPNAHPVVRGIANLRGKTVTIMDLGAAIGLPPIEATEDNYVVVTEYNKHVQGFLVSTVDRIMNMNWEEILPPPHGIGKENFLTAVTKVEGALVQIIDVEKVLAEIIDFEEQVSDDIIEEASVATQSEVQPLALISDDSSVARGQIKRTLDQLGIASVQVDNGRKALEQLRQWASQGGDMFSRLFMVISDIEMPEMDGYAFTKEVRQDHRLSDTYILLHTSLSGVFNHAMVEKVGADNFIPKFQPDVLAKAVVERLKSWHESRQKS